MVLEIPDPRAREDEARQIQHVRDDLVREYVHLPRPVVEAQVTALLAEFQLAPVRSFVPVLVRRGARQRLRQLSSS